MAPVSQALHWLSQAMAATRATHGLDLIDIAYHARVKEGTVKGWEEADHWPRELDAALAAYAKAADLDSGREIWVLALELWREDDERAAISRAAAGAAALAEDTKESRAARSAARAAKRRKPGAA